MSEEAKAIQEAAKAVQEVAKTTGKALDTTKSAGGWLDRVFGRAIEDTVGLLWTDRVAAKRVEAAIYSWERLLTLLHKAKARLRKKGVTNTRAIPPKVALPLIEHATIEHEEPLHTLFANLLATGMDPSEEDIRRKYVSTLAEMTGADAAVLKRMIEESREEISKEPSRNSRTVTFGPGVDGTYSHDEVSVITLNRLGLIEPAYIRITTFEPGGPHKGYDDLGPEQDEVNVAGNLESVTITAFGLAFAKAVGLMDDETPSEEK